MFEIFFDQGYVQTDVTYMMMNCFVIFFLWHTNFTPKLDSWEIITTIIIHIEYDYGFANNFDVENNHEMNRNMYACI